MKRNVIIIAEAGVNHDGSLEKALDLIDVAADAGADYVKFQTFKADKVVSPNAEKARYQKDNMGGSGNTQLEMLQKLEIEEFWYPLLIERCKERNIEFLSTGFDEESIDFLNDLNIPFFKVPSGEITNRPLLEHVARKGKEVVLSTGMANLKEVEDALNVIISHGLSRDDVTILHCNTEYPTLMDDVNLLAMLQIAKELNVKVGYSDHTLGIEVSLAAVALGAKVIEKHFTLDRSFFGPDHAASLEPIELKALVSGIRNVEMAISGSGIKEPSRSEEKNILIARKSLYFKRNMCCGEQLGATDLISLRPANGISPMDIEKVIGKTLSKDVIAGSPVEWNQLT